MWLFTMPEGSAWNETTRLVKRAQAGDSEAFEALVTPHESRMYAVCLRIMGNREDALDCAQEAMLRIYRSLGDYRFQAAFSTWVYRIATNICLDTIRKHKSRPAASLDALMDDGFAPTDTADTPEEAFAEQETKELLRACIAHLPEDMRAALVLRDIHGMSYEEVASILQVNLGTVKSRISRARERLRLLILEKQEQNSKKSVQTNERRKQHDL